MQRSTWRLSRASGFEAGINQDLIDVLRDSSGIMGSIAVLAPNIKSCDTSWVLLPGSVNKLQWSNHQLK